MRLRAVAILVCAAVLLAGCAGDMAFKRGEKYAIEGDWDRAIVEYRQALRDDPENVAFKTRLTKALDMAATKHIERANHYIRENNPDAALHEARLALEYSPANNKAAQVVGEATRLKDIQRRMNAGRDYLAAGRLNEALNQFYAVLDMDPKNEEARGYIEDITKRKTPLGEEQDELSLASEQPITLSFKEAKLKEVFEFLSKLSGISIVFDEDVKNQTVTVYAREVSFRQALNLMLATNKLFYKKVSEDTIIIIPKNKSKMAQYQDLVIKTFYLSNTKAKDMVNILRTMLETRKVIINETLNSITLRETPEKIDLAEKLIEANDKKDAEVVIDVEVLSVDRNDSLKYGVNLPKGVTGTYDPLSGGVAPDLATSVITSITDFKAGYKDKETLEGNIWFSYPSVTVDWSQTRGKAETLTNPQIRTLNNQPAKILIGSRIPIQTGTTVSTISTTTFEYREIGIRLNVEPNISLANDITLKTQLEVSSLGDTVSVGDFSLPRINTTTVEATLNLRDGETVIIGGLLENLKTENVSGIAGLVDTPILGKIFSTNTVGPNSKRELIMTLTPHIVRSMEIPRRAVTEFWSGTEEDYDDKPLFQMEKPRPYSGYGEGPKEYEMPVATPVAMPAAPAPEAVSPAPEKAPEGVPEAAPAPSAPEARPAPRVTVPAPRPGTAPPQGTISRVGKLGFAPEVTPLEVGQEITIDVVITDVDNLFEAPLSIIYNPKLVEFVGAAEGNMLGSDGAPTSFAATANDKVGYIDVMAARLGRVPGVSGSGTIFSLTFKGLAAGISPLVFKQNTLKDREGHTTPADLKTGTLYVK